jgi:hypothetical protein
VRVRFGNLSDTLIPFDEQANSTRSRLLVTTQDIIVVNLPGEDILTGMDMYLDHSMT